MNIIYMGKNSLIALLSKLADKYAIIGHTHSASDIINGILPVSQGGTGVSNIESLRSSINATNIICNTSEPSLQNAGDFWFKEIS